MIACTFLRLLYSLLCTFLLCESTIVLQNSEILKFLNSDPGILTLVFAILDWLQHRLLEVFIGGRVIFEWFITRISQPLPIIQGPEPFMKTIDYGVDKGLVRMRWKDQFKFIDIKWSFDFEFFTINRKCCSNSRIIENLLGWRRKRGSWFCE